MKRTFLSTSTRTTPAALAALVSIVLATVSTLFQRPCIASELDGLAENVVREIPTSDHLPAGRYAPAGEWEAAGTALGRLNGKIVDDADGGKIWEVSLPDSEHSADPPPSATLFGPYVQPAAGDYLAFFRVKLIAGGVDDQIGNLDAVVDQGGTELARRPALLSEVATGQYVELPLAFRYEHGRLELRFQWHGLASVRVAGVSLYRFSGKAFRTSPDLVEQPAPSGSPRDLDASLQPPIAAEVFPQSAAPVRRLCVVDLRGLAPDWQLCLVCLQGIVNRARPVIYCIQNATDQRWLEGLKRRGLIDGWETIPPRALLTRFASAVDGSVVFDPAIPASRHVAVMLAGLDGRLVVSPRIAEDLKLPAREDLRGRWRTNLAAYRWALDQLWPRLNHRVAACCWPRSVGSYDYFIQNKLFIFWLPGRIDGAWPCSRPAEEVRLIEELLARIPPNGAIMGFPWAGRDVGISEGPGITLFAEFAKYLVGSVNVANLSVHSGVPIREFHQLPPPPCPLLDESKVYLSVIISDGDNLPVLTTHNFPQLWDDPLRGTFPIGWTLSPSASLLLPDLVDHYYTSATPNDCFIAAVSGVGYTYPESFGLRYREPQRAGIFDGFLGLTRSAMQRSDLHENWIMRAGPAQVQQYPRQIPATRGLFLDYGRSAGSSLDATFPLERNVGVFHAITDWQENATREEQISRAVEQLRHFATNRRPVFLHYFIWNWGYDLSMIRDVLARLGPGYIAVRPDHLCSLYDQWLRKEQLLLKLPDQLWTIEGQRLSADGSLQNATSAPLRAQIALSGLSDATREPAVVQLQPGASAPLRITGNAISDSLVVDCSGDYGRRTASVPLRRIPKDEILSSIGDAHTLRFAWELGANQFSHRIGQSMPDRQAISGSVWVVAPGKTAPGHVLFGPYVPTPAGTYLALFRLKRTGSAAGDVGIIDAASSSPYHVSTSIRLSSDHLPVGEYRYAALRFEHPGGPLETRIEWSGSVPIAVDDVLLFQALRD